MSGTNNQKLFIFIEYDCSLSDVNYASNEGWRPVNGVAVGFLVLAFLLEQLGHLYSDRIVDDRFIIHSVPPPRAIWNGSVFYCFGGRLKSQSSALQNPLYSPSSRLFRSLYVSLALVYPPSCCSGKRAGWHTADMSKLSPVPYFNCFFIAVHPRLVS